MRGLVVDADPDAKWQLWYEDMFDRETPRQILAEGHGLALGLTELWRHHLRDTVQPSGSMGFSRYNLWLPEKTQSVEVAGDPVGMARLRAWILAPRVDETGPAGEALLAIVAGIHSQLVAAGLDGALIAEAVLDTGTATSLVGRLERLAGQHDDGCGHGTPPSQ